MRLGISTRNLKALAFMTLALIGLLATAGPGQIAYAQAARPNTCISATEDVWSSYENVQLTTQSAGSCLGGFPESEGWVVPCNGGRVTTDADVWLSQSTVRGGTRLAESGRTGFLTWASDCNYHEMAYVIGWGQYYTVPLWACGWYEDVDTGEAWNYVCAQAY